MNANLLVMKTGNIPFFTGRKTSRENYLLSIREAYILSLGLIGLLGIYYVFVLNVNATKGYNLRTIEIARKNYQFEESLLNIRIAEAQSLTTLANSPYASGMQQIENPKYLVLTDSLYAYKK